MGWEGAEGEVSGRKRGGRGAGVWSGEKSGAVKLKYDMVVCGYVVHVSADEVDHSMPILSRGGAGRWL